MGLDQFKSTDTESKGGKVQSYSDEEILEALQKFYNSYGQFTSDEYEENISSPSYSTVQRRFNTFNNAKIEANIPVTRSGGQQSTVSNTMKQPSRDKTFVVGCLLCDGWIHNTDSGHVGFQVKDKSLAQEFALSLSSWANLKWNGFNDDKTEMEARGPIEIDGAEDNWRVKKGSKEISGYMSKYENKSAKELISEFEDYKKDLLISIWDCEGSINECGQIKFANSDIEILKLYMFLVEDIIGVSYNQNWEWSSNKEKYRSYGEFTVSTKISDSDTRNVIIPVKYSTDFANVVNSFVTRKSKRLNEWA